MTIQQDASNIIGGINDFNPRGLPTAPKGTGVVKSPMAMPMDPYQARMQYLRDSGRGGGGGNWAVGLPAQPTVPDAVTTSINDQIAKYGTMYGGLLDRLNQYTNTERQNIGNATSRAATMMGEIDPMAGYRQTFQSLQAPTAGASTYLGAIGADPAQIQALQNFQNQMMASQSQGQSQFASAVDDVQRNYRLAQLAEVYANQARAEQALGTSVGAQQTQISLKQMEQENALRQMLLDYQMQLAVEAMRKR